MVSHWGDSRNLAQERLEWSHIRDTWIFCPHFRPVYGEVWHNDGSETRWPWKHFLSRLGKTKRTLRKNSSWSGKEKTIHLGCSLEGIGKTRNRILSCR